MELQVNRKKRNTGLLPGFENRLVTPEDIKTEAVDPQAVHALFDDCRRQMQRLMDQSKAIAPRQFIREMVELLQQCLEADYVLIADLDLQASTMQNVQGYGKTIGHFTGGIPLRPTSPFMGLADEECVIVPRNAQVRYGDSPYLLKYNINALILHRIEVEGQTRGVIGAMNITSFKHSEGICTLLQKLAVFLAVYVYGADQSG